MLLGFFGVLREYSIRRYWELGRSESLMLFFICPYRWPCPVPLQWQSIIELVSSREFRAHHEAVLSPCDPPSQSFSAALSKIHYGGGEWFGSLFFRHRRRCSSIYSQSWLSRKKAFHYYHSWSPLSTYAITPSTQFLRTFPKRIAPNSLCWVVRRSLAIHLAWLQSAMGLCFVFASPIFSHPLKFRHCWNFVPVCLISFNLIFLLLLLSWNALLHLPLSHSKLYLLASEYFFCVSVRENFLPPSGWWSSFHPHWHGIWEGGSYDKGPGHLAGNTLQICTSIKCPSELPYSNLSLARLLYTFSPFTQSEHSQTQSCIS